MAAIRAAETVWNFVETSCSSGVRACFPEGDLFLGGGPGLSAASIAGEPRGAWVFASAPLAAIAAAGFGGAERGLGEGALAVEGRVAAVVPCRAAIVAA